MRQLQVFLDLDQTLFRTDEFNTLKWALLAEWYGIDSVVEQARQESFYVYDGAMRYYDMVAHVQSLGLEWSMVSRRLQASNIVDGRLEYEGVAALISWIKSQGDVNILTYGERNYQQMKATLCPSLAGVTVLTTMRPKGEYFQSMNQDKLRWLVDDKPIGDELPPTVRFIQTVEYNGLPVPDNATWPVAITLSQVATLIKNQG